ncbi:tRNA pseudouridine synthase D [Toxoplasma gondii VEG]|uniref:tRNA pseudouridine synthase D n=1 Tax=Toxoplasma gondii (strain ATCC 50861 / VEG) TaxID=432359 RepID=V5B7V4_TOXGV|nr:tRNA pseudouridine synthase D [Toxoplasma gondii VEG]CEL73243.1 TPA: hypothetical protein BN1205_104430 [Toxoplasma gondii VEG]
MENCRDSSCLHNSFADSAEALFSYGDTRAGKERSARHCAPLRTTLRSLYTCFFMDTLSAISLLFLSRNFFFTGKTASPDPLSVWGGIQCPDTQRVDSLCPRLHLLFGLLRSRLPNRLFSAASFSLPFLVDWRDAFSADEMRPLFLLRAPRGSSPAAAETPQQSCLGFSRFDDKKSQKCSNFLSPERSPFSFVRFRYMRNRNNRKTHSSTTDPCCQPSLPYSSSSFSTSSFSTSSFSTLSSSSSFSTVSSSSFSFFSDSFRRGSSSRFSMPTLARFLPFSRSPNARFSRSAFSSNAFAAWREPPVLQLRGVQAPRTLLPEVADGEGVPRLFDEQACAPPAIATESLSSQPLSPSSSLLSPPPSSRLPPSLPSSAFASSRFSPGEDEELYTETEIGAGAFVSERPSKLEGVIRYRSEDFVVREVGEDGKVCPLDLGCNDTSGLERLDARREALLRSLRAHRQHAFRPHPSAPAHASSSRSSHGSSSSWSPPESSSSSPSSLSPGFSVETGETEDNATFVSDVGEPVRSREAVEREVAALSSVRFILTKHNRETPEALEVLARVTGVDIKRFSFAGMKDRRAVTSQWIACSNPLPLPPLASRPSSLSSPLSASSSSSSLSPSTWRDRAGEMLERQDKLRRERASEALALPSFLSDTTDASLSASASLQHPRVSAPSLSVLPPSPICGDKPVFEPPSSPPSTSSSASSSSPLSPLKTPSSGRVEETQDSRGQPGDSALCSTCAPIQESENPEPIFTAELAKKAMQHPSWDACVSWSHFEPGEVHLGCLGGNRFSILLRNVRIKTENSGPSPPSSSSSLSHDSLVSSSAVSSSFSSLPAGSTSGFSRSSKALRSSSEEENPLFEEERLAALTTEAAEAIQKFGFINYFGPQRFGTGARPTHHIGRALLHRQFARVCNLILKIPEALPAKFRGRSGPSALPHPGNADEKPSLSPPPLRPSASSKPSSLLPHSDQPSSSSSSSSFQGAAFVSAQEAFWAGDFRRALALLPRQCRQERQILRVLAAAPAPEWRRRSHAALSGDANAADNASTKAPFPQDWQRLPERAKSQATPPRNSARRERPSSAFGEGRFEAESVSSSLPGAGEKDAPRRGKNRAPRRDDLQEVRGTEFAVCAERGSSNSRSLAPGSEDRATRAKLEEFECLEAVELAAASGAISEGLARRVAASASFSGSADGGTRPRTSQTPFRALAPPQASASPFSGEREMRGAGLARREEVLKAVRSIPRLQRLIYVKAYASYLWNLCATERARVYGLCRPVVGDLVLEKAGNETMQSTAASCSSSSLLFPFERTGEARPDSQRVRSDSQRVRLLRTEEECQSFSIADVVLPLIGAGMVFPENKVGEFLRNLMNEEFLCERLYRREEELFLDASYRPLLAFPQDFSCTLESSSTPAASAAPPYAPPSSPSSSSGGESDSASVRGFNLRLDFTLPPGVFASALLREFTQSPFEHPFKQRRRELRELPRSSLPSSRSSPAPPS